MVNINWPFSSDGAHRRPPTNQELLTGNDCLPDRELHNYLWWHWTANFEAVMNAAGLTPVDNNPNELLEAIRILAPQIESDLTLYVTLSGVTSPTDPRAGDPFNKISSALSWLRRFRIAPKATVTIDVGTGTFTETSTLSLDHPDGQSIQIVGQTLTDTWPVAHTDMVGVSAGGWEATMRSILPTIVECPVQGLNCTKDGIRLIRNILFVGPGNANSVGIHIGASTNFDDAQFGINGGCSVSLMYCWFHQFGYGVVTRTTAHAALFHVGSSFSGSVGIYLYRGANLRGKDVASMYSTLDGMLLEDGCFAIVSGPASFDRNGRNGISVGLSSMNIDGDSTDRVYCRGNVSHNLNGRQAMIEARYVDLSKLSISPRSYQITDGSNLTLTDCLNVSSDSSPVPNSEGNRNSYAYSV